MITTLLATIGISGAAGGVISILSNRKLFTVIKVAKMLKKAVGRPLTEKEKEISKDYQRRVMDDPFTTD